MPFAAHLIASLTAAPEPSQTGGDVLRLVLDSDTLLFGCIAFALLAMVTVSRVAARRRKDRNARREAHAQSQALHAFLDTVRAGAGAGKQGVWHYDFTTGTQQLSDELKALLKDHEALKASGIDLARLAREHSDVIEPYEAQFHIEVSEGSTRPFMFQACNMRDAQGQVRRAVGLVREIEADPPES